MVDHMSRFDITPMPWKQYCEHLCTLWYCLGNPIVCVLVLIGLAHLICIPFENEIVDLFSVYIILFNLAKHVTQYTFNVYYCT